MAILLKGNEVATSLTEKLKIEAASLKEPCLAIVRVGEKDADLSYERGAMKRCEKVGIKVKQVVLPNNVTHEELKKVIDSLDNDNSIAGVLLFKPLPDYLMDIKSIKDVDIDPPCTAQSVIEILKYYNIQISGKNAVVIGRSDVIGKPVSMLLLDEDATVTICHSKTENLKEIAKRADILVVAMKKAEYITKDYVNPNQVVIDVGIHVKDDGSMCGDTAFSEIEPIVKAITPVPGGVGSVTTTILASHVLKKVKENEK